jgi:hypothetical protein
MHACQLRSVRIRRNKIYSHPCSGGKQSRAYSPCAICWWAPNTKSAARHLLLHPNPCLYKEKPRGEGAEKKRETPPACRASTHAKPRRRQTPVVNRKKQQDASVAETLPWWCPQSSCKTLFKVSEAVLWHRSKCLYILAVDVSHLQDDVPPRQGDDDPVAMSYAADRGCVLHLGWRSHHYVLKLQIMGVSFPHRGMMIRRYVLKLLIVDMSFPHRGRTIPSLCPKAADRGCVLPP